ncbi:hypothetical protein NHX12_010040 [Muraenolepis orangiensis]|uniref:BICD family-like cargo adapter 2 n=1 Tax=Muraenolepis orangiensis TaxID=630683 RepID=A0A9Q0DIT1_9TELE|nr:hypothetical protein NHX12_010040 [Muraenolepis orangiensis]
MLSHRKNSLPTPGIDDSYFGFSLSMPTSASSPLPGGDAEPARGDLEPDLILAAELGQALLEKNEELAASLEEKERLLETVKQQKHVLQRKLEMNELASGQKEADLAADYASLRAELEHHQQQGRDRRRDESDHLTHLSNHNQRLVEQLAEAVTLEHSLRTELRALREEMDESSFSRDISSSQQENMQAENRMLHGRLAHMTEQLQAVKEAAERLRVEREEQRERLADLQARLREKETEQSQATDALLAHSTLLSEQDELLSLREEIKPFHSNRNKPSYRELAVVQHEKESLTQQLMNTIQHKVAMSQELEAWQEDMRVVLNQQVKQHEEQLKEQQEQCEKVDKSSGLQRSKSLKVRGEGSKGFFSALFRDK